VNAVIVGSGLAGTIAAKTLRELDPRVGIEILGEERHPYYPRPNLIEYLAGRLARDRIFAFPEGWAEKQRIALRLGAKVARIRIGERTIETAEGASVAYDLLLLATGARPVLPAIAGTGLKAVFVLRTLDDAEALIGLLGANRRVVVLGGGLLGLEIARAIRGRGAEVRVVEFFDRLLPRQLDAAAAAILKGQIERSGIVVQLGAVAREILGAEGVRGVRFESGEEVEADAVIIAAGVAPEIGLAKDAGLKIGRGIVVDDRLRTSAEGIFAAGDAAEHAGRIYGIIRPRSNKPDRRPNMPTSAFYAGTVPSNTLQLPGCVPRSERSAKGRASNPSSGPMPGRGSTRRSSSRRAGSSARSGWARRRGPRRSAVSSP
jgi:nitrite reductase (NADH) large subunit